MTQRVNLTIPDELAEKLERFRDRVNMSSIFAEALRKELARLDIQSSVGDLGRTIERLRPEHSEYEKRHYQLGFDAGVTWARDEASYLQLKELADKWATDGWKWAAPTSDRGYRKALHATLVELGITTVSESGAVSLPFRKPFNEEGYQMGWVDGAVSVWKAVKDKL